MSKEYGHVAIRAIAVRAVHTALPHLTSAEIGKALGISRAMARHYMLGVAKSAEHRAPPWAPLLIEACRALAGTTQPARAAEPFERLARELYGRAGQ